MFGRRALMAAAASVPLPLAAEPMPEFSEAQRLLFETPHLLALPPPLRLDYAFLREEEGKDPVRDVIRLEVRAGAEANRRDVAPTFLTGPRAIHYPPALGFRGNPLLLFALDRDTRELSAATGGSPGWFRNRIRRALADAATLRPVVIPFDGHGIAATEIGLTPFAGEARARRYQGRHYAFLIAEAVPGWIHAIRTGTPAGEGGGAVREEITFEAMSALPAATP